MINYKIKINYVEAAKSLWGGSILSTSETLESLVLILLTLNEWICKNMWMENYIVGVFLWQ